MTEQKIRLGLVQMAMSERPGENVARAIELARAAAERGATVVCLPELFSTRYFPQYARQDAVAPESIPGPATDACSALARERGIVLIAGSVWEAHPAGNFNTAVIFGPDGRAIGQYRKVHIPHDPLFYEQNYFAPGDGGIRVFDTPAGRLAVLICYDQWYPEAARLAALQGAEMVFYPTAIGTVRGHRQREGNWHRAWENVMRGHAIANGMVVAAVNRVGVEDRMSFWGGSFVSDAFGKVLVRAGSGEQVALADVSLAHGREVREGWRFFHNRRPEVYDMLSSRME